MCTLASFDTLLKFLLSRTMLPSVQTYLREKFELEESLACFLSHKCRDLLVDSMMNEGLLNCLNSSEHRIWHFCPTSSCGRFSIHLLYMSSYFCMFYTRYCLLHAHLYAGNSSHQHSLLILANTVIAHAKRIIHTHAPQWHTHTHLCMSSSCSEIALASMLNSIKLILFPAAFVDIRL